MTRVEEIKQAAKEYCVGSSIEDACIEKPAFMVGAEWADSHPVNQWHDVNEEPEVKREIFCEWKSSTGIWHSIVFYHPYSKTFYEGERIIQNVLRWTYVDDVLEKQGEQKPIDKVEPKFKIGDWVHNVEIITDTVTISKDRYEQLLQYEQEYKQRQSMINSFMQNK